jgi:hypothetical protein
MSSHYAIRIASSVLAILVGGLAGCGLAQVTTNTTSGSSEPGQVGRANGAGDDVTRTYTRWNYQSCGAGESCGIKMAAAAGIRPDGQRNGALMNPKSGMKNPDPEWLPGWESLPADESGARDVFEAMNLAASNRTWIAECKKVYAGVKSGIDTRAAEVPALVKACENIEDPFERLGALLRLPSRSKGSPTKDREFGLGFDAAAFETERAIVDGFRKAGKLWVLAAEKLDLPVASREVLRPRWEPEIEEKAFCWRASAQGATGLSPLPPPREVYTERVLKLVKPAISDADNAELKRRAAERKKAAEQALSMDDPTGPKRLEQFKSASGETIAAFTIKDKGAVIKLTRHGEFGSSIGTVCTDSRGRTGPCPVMNVKRDRTKVITFSDWPKGLTLENGDLFYFFGEGEKSDIKGQGTPVETWNEEIRGHHLVSVKKKDGKEVVFWK